VIAAESALVLGSASGLAPAPALAENWRLTPYVNVLETLTNNVNLAPSGQEKTDLVTQVTPGLRIQGNGARVQLNGSVQVSGLLYASTGSENNQIWPQANLLGRVEALEKLFYVEGAVNVSQQFYTPFGPQPGALATATDNRYTTSSYRISPYFQGVARGNVSYLVRNDNVWTNLSGAPIDSNNAYYNNWIVRVADLVDPWGWAVDADRTDVRFNEQGSQLTQLARLRLLYQFDPQVQAFVSGGYEDNQYPLTSYSGAIYGGGVTWRPTERTNVDARWEERFFGSSYGFTANHRRPLSAFGIEITRGITSYPQLLATLPGGGNVDQLLNAAFTTRYPDPVQRQQAVDQFIAQRGLPSTLAGPVNFYTQQITLQDRQAVNFGLIGARNSLFFNVFNLKSQVIAGSGDLLPPPFGLANNNTQRGVSATYSHSLTGLTSLNAFASGTRTTALEPFTTRTTQYLFRATVSTQLSPKTTGLVGLRYQIYETNSDPVFSDYTEAAAFAGLNHTF
jgi:uncharacterized protein (PEP-CTERM system associated)